MCLNVELHLCTFFANTISDIGNISRSSTKTEINLVREHMQHFIIKNIVTQQRYQTQISYAEMIFTMKIIIKLTYQNEHFAMKDASSTGLSGRSLLSEPAKFIFQFFGCQETLNFIKKPFFFCISVELNLKLTHFIDLPNFFLNCKL